MNNYDWLEPRRRRRNLLIVEGKHEKYELMKLIIKIYPEIDMKLEDIIIYKTNIYQLYDLLRVKYDDNWFDTDVDLPFIVGKKLNLSETLHKENFMNILLVFDYERHDPSFSEEKITQLQRYFHNSTDVGKLYINYPMIEAYQHLFSIPDDTYAERCIPVSLRPGKAYKKLVKNTMIARLMNMPRKMQAILSDKFKINDEIKCSEYVEQMLLIHSEEIDISIQVREILRGAIPEKDLMTAQFHLENLINRSRYASLGITYYEYMRTIFNEIIEHNIRKGNLILGKEYEVPVHRLRTCYESISLLDILQKQNEKSRDPINGSIWVINTNVLFLCEYKI